MCEGKMCEWVDMRVCSNRRLSDTDWSNKNNSVEKLIKEKRMRRQARQGKEVAIAIFTLFGL